jgi:hypothetical protein
LFKEVKALFRQQRLNEQASEPFQPYLVVRYVATICGWHVLPEDIQNADDAEQYACDFAREHRWRVRLVLSRRQVVWISACGEVVRREEAQLGQTGLPCSHVRGHRRSLWFDLGSHLPLLIVRRGGWLESAGLAATGANPPMTPSRGPARR